MADAVPFPGSWETEVNEDYLRADARWNDETAARLAEQSVELREQSDRYTATATAQRRRADEMEEQARQVL